MAEQTQDGGCSLHSRLAVHLRKIRWRKCTQLLNSISKSATQFFTNTMAAAVDAATIVNKKNTDKMAAVYIAIKINAQI